MYIFIDSQAAIKRLQLNALTGGQELVFKITQSCSYLASRNISINFYWVPSHLGIYGNKVADKLAKKGLSRREIKSSYTSLSYIGRVAREKILEQWQNNWQQNKSKGKHYTRICKGSYSFSLKAPKDRYPKKLQSAFFQLKLGKGYFRSFTRIVETNKEGRCFRECIAIQTPKYLLLDCSLYKEERKKMQRQLGSSLSLKKLFCTKKEREALFLFLNRTEIATRKWLRAAGSLEGGNSY